jgi:hypothetical protein
MEEMLTYIGTKTIKARPATLEEVERIIGRPIDPATKEEDGYLVEYEDGYQSWSPRTVFEKTYKLYTGELG